MEKYDHSQIEKKWQERWREQRLYETADRKDGKENYYLLVEFPYPSGNLHVGHWYAFAVPDIFARYKRMRGFNVLFPIGFDAFGLPAENAAIKHGIDPEKWTYENIDHMRGQLRRMGNSFDWSREVVTADPKYYRWTQELFLKFYNEGLAYRGTALVNWDPVDKTVLANEQVLPDGTAERSGAQVEKKELEQWFFKITDYADRLIDDLEELPWPEEIKESQRNWIGRSEGALLEFEVKRQTSKEKVRVFTTRPDTLFGATYMVLAPEHPLVEQMKDSIKNWDEVSRYIQSAAKKTEIERTAEGKEKTGVRLEGISAINPATKEEIPVFVADYVLAHYGTGAIMAVPAHDERDFEFAKKFDLPIRQVVAQETGEKREDEEERHGGCGVIFDPKSQKYAVWKSDNRGGLWGLCSGGVDEGEDLHEGIRREVEEESGLHDFQHTEEIDTAYTHYYNNGKKVNRAAWATCCLFILGSAAEKEQQLDEHEEDFEIIWASPEEIFDNWNERNEGKDLDHWIFFLKKAVSRAVELGYDTTNSTYPAEDRVYVGPGVLINSGKFDGLDSEETKQKITEFVGGEMTTTYKLHDWLLSRQRYWGCPIPIVYDPEGKPHPIPSEHLPWTLPQDVNFEPTGESPLATSRELQERTERIFGEGWRPEYDTMDTFVDSSWYFLRYLDPNNNEEFASKDALREWMPVERYSGGAEHTTMHVLYSRFFYKALHDFGYVRESEPYVERFNRGLILDENGRKMSKRWGNVVDPDEQVEKFGADTVKTYLAFIGPYNEVGAYPWSEGGITGVRRFLERIWRFSERVTDTEADADVERLLHQSIKKSEEGIEAFKFNTVVSQLMILASALEKLEQVPANVFRDFVKILAPFAPHIAEELWERSGGGGSVHTNAWPGYNPEKAKAEVVTIAVQVNGKVRGEFEAPAEVDEKTAKQSALKLSAVQKRLEGKEPSKVIYVPGRLVNIVCE